MTVKEELLDPSRETEEERFAKLKKALESQPNHLAGKHLPYGSLFGFDYGFNFMDANIGFLDFGINTHELEAIRKLRVMQQKGCDAESKITLEEIAAKILRDETTFDLSQYNISTSTKGAREAIITALETIVTPQKPFVMYASPNWIFDGIVGSVKEARIVETFIPTADDFVEKFEFISTRIPLCAVILVDPANPLGYRFSKRHIERIEKVAEEQGIIPLFDDVFRGLQEKGKRHSSSEYSHRSIIIETTSKRFGARGLGVTWTLTPKELNLKLTAKEESCLGCSSLAASVTQSLYETKYGERIQAYITANADAFKQGFYDSFTADNLIGTKKTIGRFVHAFESMPFMTYHFEEVEPELTINLVRDLKEIYGLRITQGFDWICQIREKEKAIKEGKVTSLIEREASFASSYVRICPTKETPERSYIAGNQLGTTMQELA